VKTGRPIPKLWLPILLAVAFPVGAGSVLETEKEFDGVIEKPEKQQELAVGPPPYPRDSDLVEVHIPELSGRLRYALDMENLTVAKDGIVRYTMVISSAAGARNVFFEGIDCGQRRFKTYAYDTGDGEFREKKGPRWQRIANRGSQSFRDELRQGYFCGRFGSARPPQEIRARLRGDVTLDL
jgi:hypothetical protein